MPCPLLPWTGAASVVVILSDASLSVHEADSQTLRLLIMLDELESAYRQDWGESRAPASGHVVAELQVLSVAPSRIYVCTFYDMP